LNAIEEEDVFFRELMPKKFRKSMKYELKAQKLVLVAKYWFGGNAITTRYNRSMTVTTPKKCYNVKPMVSAL